MCKDPLSETDIGTIVQTLLYDDQVTETSDAAEITYRKMTWPINVEESALASVPCGVCPVADQCHPGGVVAPETCVYWQRYLQF